MYLQEILEVAIGLVFVWFVISMFAMTIQEWIASVFSLRANYLETTLLRMLDDPNFEKGFSAWWRKLWNKTARNRKMVDFETSFAKKFYNHHLIRVLSLPYKKPSYISVSKFADVILDMLLTAGTDASIIRSSLEKARENLDVLVSEDRNTAARESLDSLIELAKHAAETDAGAETIEKLRKEVDAYARKYPAVKPLVDTFLTIPPPDQPIENTLQRLSHGIFVIGAKNEHLRESLAPLILNAEKYVANKEEAIAKARLNVEQWFNETMDRLSGVYKRRVQVVSFLVGVSLALLVNLDSVSITESLWREPTLRQALVIQAELEAARGVESGQVLGDAGSLNPVSDLQERFKDLSVPLGWTIIPKDNATVALCKWIPTADRKDDDRFGIRMPSIQSIEDIKLYFSGEAKALCYSPAVNSNSTNGYAWLLGILITGGAASQGAPFWFEILSKLVNVRSVGGKPDERTQKKG
jgi:hypothetical protein